MYSSVANIAHLEGPIGGASISIAEFVPVPSQARLNLLNLLYFVAHLFAIILFKPLLNGQVKFFSGVLLAHVVEELVSCSSIKLIYSTFIGLFELLALLYHLIHLTCCLTSFCWCTSNLVAGDLMLAKDLSDVLVTLDSNMINLNRSRLSFRFLLSVERADELRDENWLARSLCKLWGVAFLGVSVTLRG